MILVGKYSHLEDRGGNIGTTLSWVLVGENLFHIGSGSRRVVCFITMLIQVTAYKLVLHVF
jgi:hypothetical protein